jgi:xanthine dehydrogenase accessory factor
MGSMSMDAHKALSQVCAHLEAGEAVCLLTLVEVQGTAPRAAGAKMAVLGNGTTVGTLGGGTLEQEARRIALEVLERGRARLVELGNHEDCGGRVRIFADPLLPLASLVIVGAGHVGQALAQAASLAGFQALLLDDRPDQGEDVCQVTSMQDVFANTRIRPSTRVVIATRSHDLDLKVLRQALALPCAYIGLLGSRRKRETFFTTLRQEGVSEKDLARIRCPVGLDIRARSPGEIAISILAELIALQHKQGNAPISGSFPKVPHTP